MNCEEFVESFANGEITDEMRAHVKSCARCGELIRVLAEDQTVAVPVETSARAAEEEVVRTRKRSALVRGAAILVAIVVFFGLVMLAAGKGSGLGFGEAALVSATAVFIAILVGVPALLLFQAVATARTATGGRRFYKRLGRGRLLSGVCRGIAEATGIDVTILRVAFVLLTWFKGVGLLAYIVCDLAMPVHPADREHLLRFKIARGMRRLAHAARATWPHEG